MSNSHMIYIMSDERTSIKCTKLNMLTKLAQ